MPQSASPHERLNPLVPNFETKNQKFIKLQIYIQGNNWEWQSLTIATQ